MPARVPRVGAFVLCYSPQWWKGPRPGTVISVMGAAPHLKVNVKVYKDRHTGESSELGELHDVRVYEPEVTPVDIGDPHCVWPMGRVQRKAAWRMVAANRPSNLISAAIDCYAQKLVHEPLKAIRSLQLIVSDLTKASVGISNEVLGSKDLIIKATGESMQQIQETTRDCLQRIKSIQASSVAQKVRKSNRSKSATSKASARLNKKSRRR